MRIVAGLPDDPSCFCYADASLNPDTVFSILVSTITRNPFLRIIEGNETKRFLRFISERKEDPREIIELEVKFLSIQSKVDYCMFVLRSHDEQWLETNRSDMRIDIKHDKRVKGSLIETLALPILLAENDYNLQKAKESLQWYST